MDALSEAAARCIEAEGTSEAQWRAWSALAAAPALSLDALSPVGARLWVVAPHPDDEVLACGGMLAMLATLTREVRVVGVTDGEASHHDVPGSDPAGLAALRRLERHGGLGLLGSPPCVLLGLPDGGVSRCESALAASLEEMLGPTDVVVTTCRMDGHPDHEATGRAACRAAARAGCTAFEVPIWLWHWAGPGDPRVPWSRLRRLDLSADARRAKADAIAQHRSQVLARGDLPPVLGPHALERWLRPAEYFFVGEVDALA